jgi:ankyrin repeat protein
MGKNMETRFLPATQAIRRGETEVLKQLLDAEPGLGSARSTESHPTLLQCLVLDGHELPAETQTAMATALVDAGAPLDEPLIAAGSCGNVVLAEFLFDRGAALNGDPTLLRGWTVLEEAIYWGFPLLIDHLLARGASVHNLRTAAGLGRLDEVLGFFDDVHTLNVDRAGEINWPFGNLPAGHRSREPQDLLDNALCYAALGDHLHVVRLLLSRGAGLDAIPKGFHFAGSALHWAAIRGLRDTCRFLLEQGADRELHDATLNLTPAGWARHGGHDELARMFGSG